MSRWDNPQCHWPLIWQGWSSNRWACPVESTAAVGGSFITAGRLRRQTSGTPTVWGLWGIAPRMDMAGNNSGNAEVNGRNTIKSLYHLQGSPFGDERTKVHSLCGWMSDDPHFTWIKFSSCIWHVENEEEDRTSPESVRSKSLYYTPYWLESP